MSLGRLAIDGGAGPFLNCGVIARRFKYPLEKTAETYARHELSRSNRPEAVSIRSPNALVRSTLESYPKSSNKFPKGWKNYQMHSLRKGKDEKDSCGHLDALSLGATSPIALAQTPLIRCVSHH